MCLLYELSCLMVFRKTFEKNLQIKISHIYLVYINVLEGIKSSF